MDEQPERRTGAEDPRAVLAERFDPPPGLLPPRPTRVPDDPRRMSPLQASLVRPVRVVGRVGLNLLPFFDEPDPVRPASNTSWVWSLRRFARSAVWLLPGYAVLLAISTAGADGLRRSATFSAGAGLRVLGLALATWVGLLALTALTGLLATARTRGTATAGLLLAMFGALLLPLAPLGGPGFVRVLALLGGGVLTLGWVLAGLAVARSGVFGAFDGTLLVIAAPMIGLGGLLLGILQTVGALLVLAAGIGIAAKTGRLLPKPGSTLAPEPSGGAPA
ncbi:hypothetical protein [Plantactinospora sp. KBS50]|uniref:hypothetical protein n=1 Tax=Plantactinospora sp. KBS50 TaxID=2024580 RepID=UPI000BAAEE2C|nr:hypothetical protein [Plantactinospora sp. KBS50]ASW55853.1 hypothetical protein CIK06_19275 [Plantactinospora sp. KBS50]